MHAENVICKQTLKINFLTSYQSFFCSAGLRPFRITFKTTPDEVTNFSITGGVMVTGDQVSLLIKAMRSANAYASYAKTTEFRVIPRFVITVFDENNSVTLTLT